MHNLDFIIFFKLISFKLYWKGKTEALGQKKTLCQRHIPKPQTMKLANNRTTYSTTLYLKLIGIYIYIYNLSWYFAETLCFRQKDQWANHVYGNSRCYFWECAETHKYTAWPKNVIFLVLKLPVCTPTVRVLNDKYSSQKLCCIKWNGPSNCH